MLLLLGSYTLSFSQIAGDVSGDNIVDASDYLMLKQIAIGKKKETRTSDINANGKVNVQDLLILENYIYKNGPDPSARNFTVPKYPVQLTPGIVDLDKKTMEILISSQEDISAFQFEIQGVGDIEEIISGKAKDKDFTLSHQGSRVIGIIGTGRPLLSGEALLLKIKFTTEAFEKACIFQPIILTAEAAPFTVQLGECISENATAKGMSDLVDALTSNEPLDPNSDLNHDGYVDINDLILLENFLYRDGPPPAGTKEELSKKVKLSIESIDLDMKVAKIRVHHSRPISGLQMHFFGIDNIKEVASSRLENNGFNVSHSSNKMIAHIGEGFPLLPEKGVLFELVYDNASGKELCIGNPIFTNPEGSPYVIQLGECISLVKPVPGCMDSTSLTYNVLATVDDGSCEYPPKPEKIKDEPIEEVAMAEPKEKEKKKKEKEEKQAKPKKVKEAKPEKTKEEKPEKVKEPKPSKVQEEKPEKIKEEKPEKAKEPKPVKIKEEKTKPAKEEKPKKDVIEDEKPVETKSISIHDIKKGVMVPIVTTAERKNLSDLKKGTMVYDSDVQGYVFYDGKGWKMVGASVDKSPKRLFKKIPILGLWSRKKENAK